MAAEQAEPAQHADLQTAWLTPRAGGGPEREQCAFRVPGQGAGKLKGVAFAAAK